MSVGAELKQAREARGLSLDDLARATKIPASSLDALERGSLAELPPANYVRGFVRVYATEVGLDPAATVDRYLEQFGSDVLPLEEEGDAAESPRPISRTRIAPDAVIAGAPAKGAVEPAFDARPPLASPSPAAGDKPRPPYATIGVAALMVLAGYLFLRQPDGATANDAAPPPVNQSAAFDPSVVPPTPPGEVPLVPELEPVADPVPPPQTEPVIVPEIDPAPGSAAPMAPRTAAPAQAAARPPAHNISGTWMLMTNIQTTTHAEFRGLQLGYRVELSQRDDRVTGTGQKVTENGRPIAPGGRTPIVLDGTIAGTHLELTFSERGAERSSGGTFVLDLGRDGAMRGRFSSDAARSSGSLHAQRAR